MSSAPNGIVIRAPEHRDEVMLAQDLMAKVSRGNFYDALRRVQTHVSYPNHRPEYTRIAWRNGELAGALQLKEDTIRLGEARLHMGGLGWVCTAEQHRHKGVARELIADSLQFLRHRGFHVAMLFGIPNFYHRFGFTTTLAQHQVNIATADALRVSGRGLRMRTGRPGDIATVQRIHLAEDAATACSIIRVGLHLSSRWDLWQNLHILHDDRGRILGYFVPRRMGDTLVIDEVGAADRASRDDVLLACGRLAAEELLTELEFHLPPGHPFHLYLSQHRSRHASTLTHDGGGMMAFVNLGETLESLVPEWEAQLNQSAARSLRVEATLVVGRLAYRVRAARGAIDVVPTSGANKLGLSEAELMQLITGYAYLDEVLAQRRRMLSPESRLLLAALFPKRSAFVWPLDRF